MSDIVKVMAVKSIMRRIGMPAMARIGRTQKNYSMLATDSCFAGGIMTGI
jgi:hypothetical protein